MLINFSNHPYAIWEEEQQKVADNLYGKVVDLSFPTVPPDADKDDLLQIAGDCMDSIRAISSPSEATVHVMGEMTLTYLLVSMLKQIGYTCVASTSLREVYEQEQGKKIVYFKFVRFREY